MNLNTLARDAANLNRLDKGIDVSQAREIIRCLGDVVLAKPEYMSIICKYMLRKSKMKKSDESK